MKKTSDKERYCGNCGSHNAYNYPDEVFCGKRLADAKDPVVETLWCCEDWNPSSQECYCVREAMAKRK
jgi:hypothetical protein